MSAEDCIFCKILAGQVPATRVQEADRAVAIMDINPATAGHVLVIPRTHTRDLLEISQDDLAACVELAQSIARRMHDGLGAAGVNLINSCGAPAWQTVFHFHLHVIPRYEGDPLKLPWVPAPGDPHTIAAAAAALSQ